MSDLTNDEQHLRRLALEASYKWDSQEGMSPCIDEDFDLYYARGPIFPFRSYKEGILRASKDATFIAAANPQVVLALLAEIERLRLFERAMQSMAAQFVHPKVTAEQMAKEQLGIEE